MGALAFHRPDFLTCLSENLPHDSANVHFKKRLVSYTISPDDSSQAITLQFKDGTTATCDVLIGADGIHSPTRHVMLELAARDLEAAKNAEGAKELRAKIEPQWSGLVSYRTVANAEKVRALNPNHLALTQYISVSTLRI